MATSPVFAALLVLSTPARAIEPRAARYGEDADELFWFIQVSDSHIGAELGYGSSDTDHLEEALGATVDTGGADTGPTDTADSTEPDTGPGDSAGPDSGMGDSAPGADSGVAATGKSAPGRCACSAAGSPGEWGFLPLLAGGTWWARCVRRHPWPPPCPERR